MLQSKNVKLNKWKIHINIIYEEWIRGLERFFVIASILIALYSLIYNADRIIGVVALLVALFSFLFLELIIKFSRKEVKHSIDSYFIKK